MSALVVEPEPPIARRIREARRRLDTFLVAAETCTTEHGRRTAEEAAGWVRERVAVLEQQRLASLRTRLWAR